MNDLTDLDSYVCEDVALGFIKQGQVLPLVITPKQPELDLVKWGEKKPFIETLVHRYGGLLFRGFTVDSAETFEAFIASVSSKVLPYKERSSPRKAVGGNVYTSTEHPENESLFFHSEQSYNLNFPMRIFFYCQTPAQSGGNTPIADARKIYQNIHAKVVARMVEKKYRYSRYFWPMIGITWQTTFQTDDKQVVEKYCDDNDIKYQWQQDDALKTYQIRPTLSVHPVSGEKCWFNHCAFFNVSTLLKPVQDMLRYSFADDELPNNTYYADGSPIEANVLNELRRAYEDEKVDFGWQKGDVMMLDNMLVTHGRDPFLGERKILVGMSEVSNWSDCEYREQKKER